MSDKSRNMNDINDQKTAEQQAFSKEIRRRLAEPGSGKPTLDEFKVMVYKDREKRRKKRNAMVACVVAAFIVGYLAFDELVPEVGADKNPKETIQTEDGVIIEDGGYGSSVGENNVWVITEWRHIDDIKALDSRIVIPKYVPKEYSFEKLKVEKVVQNDYICEYFFSNGKDSLEIETMIFSTGENCLNISNIKRKVESNKGTIYIQDGEKKLATMQVDGGITVNVWGSVSDVQIKNIIEGLSH